MQFTLPSKIALSGKGRAIIKVSLFHPHHSLSSNNIQTRTNRIRKKIYHTCIAKHSIIIRYAGITTAIVLILSTFAFASFSIPSNEQIQTAYALPESGCIAYDAATLTITVSCIHEGTKPPWAHILYFLSVVTPWHIICWLVKSMLPTYKTPFIIVS
jgi:hypothetical protein